MDPRAGLGGLTYDDLLALPEEGKGYELVDGELVQKATPRPSHSYSHHGISGAAYGASVQGGGGWWILIEPDWKITRRRVLRPDLAGWRRERVEFLPEGPLELRPDWVCEVLSPGHHGYDRGKKRRMYAEAGVPWHWLLDPDDPLLEVFHLRDGAWVLEGAYVDEVVDLPPFGIPTDVAKLFVPRPSLVHDR